MRYWNVQPLSKYLVFFVHVLPFCKHLLLTTEQTTHALASVTSIIRRPANLRPVLYQRTRNRMFIASGVANSIIGGGGTYSYIRVHRPWKQSISNEINCAEHEYMNMCPPPPNYWVCYATVYSSYTSNVIMRYVVTKTKCEHWRHERTFTKH